MNRKGVVYIMKKYRVFATNKLLIYLNDKTYIVKVLKDCEKLDDSEAYLYNGYVYPYLGVTDNRDDEVGIYKRNPEAKYKIREPKTEEEKETYSIEKIVELDPIAILKDIEINADNYVSKEYIEAVNNATDIYDPPIEPGDDILKKIISWCE